MKVKVLDSVELVVNYVTVVKGVKTFNSMPLAEWMKMKPEDRPDGTLKVTNVPVEDVEKGEVDIPGLTKEGFGLRCRIVRPPKDANWLPFVDASLIKVNTDFKLDDAIDAFFS